MHAALFQTAVCPHGHYCPQGTGHPHTFPCQAGQYRNNTLGHSGAVCVLCPARHYCDRQGTHRPSVCPQVGIPTAFFVAFKRHKRNLPCGCLQLCVRNTSISLVCHNVNRDFIVRRALLLLNLAPREPTALVRFSVTGLSAPLVAEASIAAPWDCHSRLEAAKNDTTAEREPNLLYENDILILGFLVFNNVSLSV